MAVEAVEIIPHFKLKDIIAQQQSIKENLTQKGTIAREYIQKLLDNLEAKSLNSKAMANGFEFSDLPTQVQKMLGGPKDRYAIEFKIDRKVVSVFVLKIQNLCDKDRGIKVEFYTQTGLQPYGFGFQTADEHPRAEVIADFVQIDDFKHDKNLSTILAAMLLGKASRYLL